MLGMDFKDLILYIPITLLAITVHEFAHGWVSYKLGDPTPNYEGRLTLNPLAHLDPIGTLLMVFTGFGWAKPVAVNPMYYRNRKGGMALVAVAGPLSNFLMAFIGVILFYATRILQIKTGISGALIESLCYAFQLFIFRNLAFMVFNLIPIPPLDGAKVLGMFLPDRIYYKMLEYERYAMLVIMLLSLSGVLSRVLMVGIDAILNLMLNVVGLVANLII